MLNTVGRAENSVHALYEYFGNLQEEQKMAFVFFIELRACIFADILEGINPLQMLLSFTYLNIKATLNHSSTILSENVFIKPALKSCNYRITFCALCKRPNAYKMSKCPSTQIHVNSRFISNIVSI